MSKEKQNGFKETIRINCPMRHENGNCLVAGGFCTAVNTPICEALHSAYDAGKMHSIEEMKKQGYRKQSEGEWKINCDGYYPYCSNCKTEPKNGVMSNFCPQCGAKMKGGAE